MVAFRKVWFLGVFLWIFESFSFNQKALAVQEKTATTQTVEPKNTLARAEIQEYRHKLRDLENRGKKIGEKLTDLIINMNKPDLVNSQQPGNLTSTQIMREMQGLNKQKAKIWEDYINVVDVSVLTSEQRSALETLISSIYSGNPIIFTNFEHIHYANKIINGEFYGSNASIVNNIFQALSAVTRQSNAWFIKLGPIENIKSQTSARNFLNNGWYFDITAIVEVLLLNRGFYKVKSEYREKFINFGFNYLAHTLPTEYFYDILKSYKAVLDAFQATDPSILLKMGIEIPSKQASSHMDGQSQYDRILEAIQATLTILEKALDGQTEIKYIVPGTKIVTSFLQTQRHYKKKSLRP